MSTATKEITALPRLTRTIALEITPIQRAAKRKKSEEELKRLADEAEARKAAGQPEPDPEDVDDEQDEEDQRDADSFNMSFSSDAPVLRWFGYEILDHSAECVDMSRAAEGLSYLADHNTRDQIGIAENLALQKGKFGGTVRFSRSARAQDIKRDVQDKIRKFTSIGYDVQDMRLEKEEGEGDNKVRTYRVTRWAPMEVSTVAVPADISVGAGRSADAEAFPAEFINSKGERLKLTPFKEVRSAAGAPTPQIPIEVKKMEPKNAAEIMRLCTTHIADPKRAMEFATTLMSKEGMTVDIASREILAEVAKATAAPGELRTVAAEQTTEMLALTDKEQKSYNLCRGIMAVVHNGENKRSRINCLELEVSNEIEKKWEGKKDERGGLFVPFRLGVDPLKARAAAEYLQRAGISTVLSAGASTKGSELVFTEPMEFIQFLYNQMKLKELGANVVSGLTGNVAFPKQTGRATGSWVGENQGTDVADSNLTLAQVTGTPRTYQTSSGYTRQLLAQAPSAGIDIDSLVRTDLARDAALALDLAGIAGLGSGSNQPLGILGTTGVQPYVVDADSGNGGVIQWSDITKMQELLEEANADQVGEPKWLTTPGIKGLLKRTPELVYTPPGASTTVNVTGTPIWAKGNEIDGLTARWSNQVPSNLVKGSSGATCHAFILGVFSTLVNGLWGSGFELVVDPYRLKKQGIIELTTFILTDWINRYPVAFAVAKDVTKS